MKLRMLNGTHSSLAYLGDLAGHETIADLMGDRVFQTYVRHLWTNEIIPTLMPPSGENQHAYAEALFQRYYNPAMRHRTWQIAMDGSQKLRRHMLGTLTDNLKAGRPSPGLTLEVAAWMRSAGGWDEAGLPIEVKDPLSGRLRDICDAAPDDTGRVGALLGVRDVFLPDVAGALLPAVTDAYRTLVAHGARCAVSGKGL